MIRKGRRCVFYKQHIDTLKDIFSGVCEQFEITLVEFDGEEDHVHLLIHYPPKVSLSRIINSLKGVSSRKIKLIHPELNKRYYKGALWSPSYFAGSCGGAPIEIVRQYIEQQKTPH
jgi:putative transposase